MIASILKFITILSLGATTLSKPVNSRRHVTPVTNTRRDASFDNFNGLSSLSNFDGFFGSSNFDGSSNKQIVVEEKQVVCHQIDVKVLQQRMTVIREFIKRTIVEQVCEVETQTIVLEQFNSGIDSFGRDVRRQSGRQISYDSNIAGMFSQLQDSAGNLQSNDLDFNGDIVGSNGVIVSGDNWNSNTSPAIVGNAWNQAQNARNGAQAQNATSSAITTDIPSATSSSSSTGSASSTASS